MSTIQRKLLINNWIYFYRIVSPNVVQNLTLYVRVTIKQRRPKYPPSLFCAGSGLFTISRWTRWKNCYAILLLHLQSGHFRSIHLIPDHDHVLINRRLKQSIFRIVSILVHSEWNFGRIMVWRSSVRPSVCLFVRLSVCPSVSHIMSAQYLEKFMMDSHGTW